MRNHYAEECGARPGWTELTEDGVIAGTLDFMSLEAADGKEPDPRSDLFSLGATAYFLLTGKSPFARESAGKTRNAIIREEPTPLRHLRTDVPADLEEVVLRCLEKELNRRFQTAQELEGALAACCCAAEWDSKAAAAWWLAQRPANSPVTGQEPAAG